MNTFTLTVLIGVTQLQRFTVCSLLG